jgi:hypothetical protein
MRTSSRMIVACVCLKSCSGIADGVTATSRRAQQRSASVNVREKVIAAPCADHAMLDAPPLPR